MVLNGGIEGQESPSATCHNGHKGRITPLKRCPLLSFKRREAYAAPHPDGLEFRVHCRALPNKPRDTFTETSQHLPGIKLLATRNLECSPSVWKNENIKYRMNQKLLLDIDGLSSTNDLVHNLEQSTWKERVIVQITEQNERGSRILDASQS